MTLNPFQSRLGIIARQEVVDAFRSRRIISLLVVYFAGAVTACAVFVKVLHRIENQLLSAFGLSVSSQAGSVTQTLWRSSHFQNILTELVGDRAVAERLLAIPPMGIFFGWVAFQFTPLLVILLSAPRLAEDIGSGAARYPLLRTHRSTWCLGLFAGQAILLALALFGAALGGWIVGVGWMRSFEPGLTALALLAFSARAWVYALPFLGLALGLSALVRSGVVATGLALTGLVAITVVAVLADYYAAPGVRRILEVILAFTPRGHHALLWRMDAAHLVPALAILPALALLYLSAGYARLRRRDL